MNSTRVLLHIGPYGLDPAIVQLLRDTCDGATIVESKKGETFEQMDGSQIDAIVTEDIPRNLSAWPRLRFVQLFSAGFDHLKGHPVWGTEIAIANSSGTHTVPIAQYVTCAVLMMALRMPQLMTLATTRKWAPEGLDSVIVRGQTVGIIGYGSIGRECARQLNALGMRILCLKRNPDARRDAGFTAWPGTGDPEGRIPDRWFGPKQLHEMLPLCDTLLLTVPSTPETLGLIGAAELALLKRSAVVINVARGGIVDEPALAAALREGKLGGAVVDCFTKEPLPSDHLFFGVPNLILTPHMSGVSVEFWPMMARLLGENLRRFRNGEPILNRVNGRLGY